MLKIKKYSGEFVDFDINKLRASLFKSGAKADAIDEVVDKIVPRLHEGIATKELYKLAFRELKKQANSFAARYSLKRALRDLGPDGYYFEKWVGRLFENEGYQVLTSMTLQGHSVSHEIDVLAQKDDGFEIAECKFRNTPEAKISVTTPMYYLSRIRDLTKKNQLVFDQNLMLTGGWLVTNAYFTSDSIRFSEYYGIRLLAWDYPTEASIKKKVDHAGLYPITCLTSISKSEKAQLLQKNCILVKDIIKRPEVLDAFSLSASKRNKIIDEASQLVYY